MSNSNIQKHSNILSPKHKKDLLLVTDVTPNGNNLHSEKNSDYVWVNGDYTHVNVIKERLWWKRIGIAVICLFVVLLVLANAGVINGFVVFSNIMLVVMVLFWVLLFGVVAFAFSGF